MAAYYKRKRKFVAEFKNAPCTDCYGWFHPVQMDFDHRPGEKKEFSISQPRISKLVEFYKEMKKCDLVCANCHRLRTYRRNQHGANNSVLISRDIDRNQL
jgi:penicillin-binding protein-related factor A (putative recombinase)